MDWNSVSRNVKVIRCFSAYDFRSALDTAKGRLLMIYNPLTFRADFINWLSWRMRDLTRESTVLSFRTNGASTYHDHVVYALVMVRTLGEGVKAILMKHPSLRGNVTFSLEEVIGWEGQRPLLEWL